MTEARFTKGPWEPISSAPMSGTDILAHLAYSDGSSGGQHVICYGNGAWRLSAITSIVLAPTGDSDDDQFPTAWKPLDEVPDALKKARGE